MNNSHIALIANLITINNYLNVVKEDFKEDKLICNQYSFLQSKIKKELLKLLIKDNDSLNNLLIINEAK